MSERRNVRGCNWGNVSLENKQLKFQNRDKQIFSIPVESIQNSMVNKQDLILELNTDNLDDNQDMISEIRFFAPQEQKKKDEKQDDEEQNENENEDEEEEDDIEKDKFIKELNKQIIKEAQIGQNAGESIATFTDLQLAVPRGKYTVDFYKTFIRFHGASYNYTIEYKNISRTFLLPQSDEVNVAFVISLLKPIKQGNTIHPFIVVNFKKQSQITLELKAKQEDIEKYEWKVQPDETCEGLTNEIFATLFKKIIRCNIFIPGSFESSDKCKSVSCSVKTNQGYLFPLQKSIVFINKPVIYIPHSEIMVAEFDRVSQGQKMFDLKIITRQIEQTFTGFEKKELNIIMNYFKNSKVKVRTTEPYNDQETAEVGGLLRKSRGEGKREIKHKAVALPLGDDDDEEDDSDFDGNGQESSEDDDDDDEDMSMDGSVKNSED